MNNWKDIQAVLLSRTSIVVVEMVIVSLVTFLNFAVIVRLTSLEIVGLWVLMSSILGISRAADIWSRGVSGYVAQARGEQGDSVAVSYVTTAAISGAAGYIMVICIALPALYFATPLLVDKQYHGLIRNMLPLMAIGFWLMSMSTIYQLGFLGFMAPIYKAIQTISGSVVFLALTILLAPKYGLIGLLVAQVIQALFMLTFAILVFHKILAPVENLKLWDTEKFKSLAIFGTGATGIGLLQVLTEPIIRLVANYFGGLAVVTIVDFTSRLIQIVRNMVGALGQNLIPSFASQTRAPQDEQVNYFRTSMDIVFCLSLTFLTAAIGISPLLGMLVLDLNDASIPQITSILAIGWLTNLIASPAYFFLFGRRRVGPLLQSQLIMVIGMIVFSIIGGVLNGLMAALLGSMIGVLISSVYIVMASSKIIAPEESLFHWIKPIHFPLMGSFLLSIVLANARWELMEFFAVSPIQADISIALLTVFSIFLFFPYKKFLLMLKQLDSDLSNDLG